jgi:hypothetical protein
LVQEQRDRIENSEKKDDRRKQASSIDREARCPSLVMDGDVSHREASNQICTIKVYNGGHILSFKGEEWGGDRIKL